MSLQATMEASIQVAAVSSLIEQGFLAKNGFEEEEQEEQNMEGFICRSKGFILVNLPNPKEEFFDA